ncbi:MAG: hypothetical protein ACI9RO_000488 [Alteromonas macleodii]|jgi:hypothetical protein
MTKLGLKNWQLALIVLWRNIEIMWHKAKETQFFEFGT